MSIASNLFKRHLGEGYDMFNTINSQVQKLLEDNTTDELPHPESAPKDLEEVGVEVLECSDSQAKLLKKHGYTISDDMKTAKDENGKVLNIEDALKSIKYLAKDTKTPTSRVAKGMYGKDKNNEAENLDGPRSRSLVSRAVCEDNVGSEANIIHSVTDADEIADDFEDSIATSNDDNMTCSDVEDCDVYYDEGDADFYVVDDDETNEAIMRKKAVSYSGGKRHLVSKIVHKLPPKEGYDRVVNRKTGAESYRLRSSSQRSHSMMLQSSMHARRARKLARLARQRSQK